MACISRQPECQRGAGSTPEPLPQITSIISGISGFFSVGSAIIKGLDAIHIVGTSSSVIIGGTPSTTGGITTVAGGFAIGSAAALSYVAAIVAVLVVISIIIWYGANSCSGGGGFPECFEGVVQNTLGGYSSPEEIIFPFTGRHDRIDIIVKSNYWDNLENENAFVHCTNEITPFRSEILRCYVKSERVCLAATGAGIGAAIGGTLGVIAGVAIAAAIVGVICAVPPITLICLIVALLVATVIAAVAALAGAFIGGNIAQASADTSTSMDMVSVGNLVTVIGNMERRDADNKAWVVRRAKSLYDTVRR